MPRVPRGSFLAAASTKLCGAACKTPNFAGTRYPNKPNRRHARRQKPPQGHSNGSRHPPGRSRLPFDRLQTLKTLKMPRRPQQWLKSTPRPQQWLLLSQAKATTRPQQWLKASPRPQQWLLIGVQGCRLTGFKPLKCVHASGASRHSFLAAASSRQLPPSFVAPHAKRPTSQANGTPRSPTGATPAGKSHHKATAMAQGIPPAAAMASYRRSRLPFDRLQTLKTLKMPRRPQQWLKSTPRPQQWLLLSQAKATTRPQQWLKASPRPQQWLLIGVQGCRLTGFKPLQRLK